ncbi:hypothetical protein CSY93_21360 [Salmonella enterica]|nr:hypothetical protein [Salmonella enterica subsp. salamae serovar Sofia]ECF6016434.1 type VI secretion system tube protein Hcp [Salmonella enterica subsp. salamae serovar Sofia]EDL8862661.1 hypothetical protein [Salmonella enterica]EDQ9771773.1 type VI secretion system tube protein Hcp [Salmonella enterica subsp. salamae]
MSTTIYIKIDKVDGTVSEPNHLKWIKATGFHWTSSCPQRKESDATKNSNGIIFTKEMDESSPFLLKKSSRGDTSEKIKIDFCRLNGDSMYTFAQAEIKDYKFSHASLDIVPEFGSALETYGITFDVVEWKYFTGNKKLPRNQK